MQWLADRTGQSFDQLVAYSPPAGVAFERPAADPKLTPSPVGQAPVERTSIPDGGRARANAAPARA